MYSLRDEYDSRLEGMYNILESSIVVEKFGFKFKNKDKDYSISTINSEIIAIKNNIKEIIDNNEDIKEFYNNGLKITSNRDTFEFADEKDGEQYKSGCVFYIVDIDLNKYKKEKLKTRRDPHPIDEPQNKLEKMINKLIKKNYPNFKYSGYDGDWDKGSLYLTLK